jgi:hypothetical protein
MTASLGVAEGDLDVDCGVIGRGILKGSTGNDEDEEPVSSLVYSSSGGPSESPERLAERNDCVSSSSCSRCLTSSLQLACSMPDSSA